MSRRGLLTVLAAVVAVGVALVVPRVPLRALMVAVFVPVMFAGVLFFTRARVARTSGYSFARLVLLGSLGVAGSIVLGFLVTAFSWMIWGPSYEGVSGPVGLHAFGVWMADTSIAAWVLALSWTPKADAVASAGDGRTQSSVWRFDPDR